jgi:hypothetical protein
MQNKKIVYLIVIVLGCNTPKDNRIDNIKAENLIHNENNALQLDDNASLLSIVDIAKKINWGTFNSVSIQKTLDSNYISTILNTNFDNNKRAVVEANPNIGWNFRFYLQKIDKRYCLMKLGHLKFPEDIPEYLFMPNMSNSFFLVDIIDERIIFFGFGSNSEFAVANIISVIELSKFLEFIKEIEISSSMIQNLITYNFEKKSMDVKKSNVNKSINKITVKDLYKILNEDEEHAYFDKLSKHYKMDSYRLKLPIWLMDNSEKKW